VLCCCTDTLHSIVADLLVAVPPVEQDKN